MKRRQLLSLAAAMSSGSLLSACGGGDTTATFERAQGAMEQPMAATTTYKSRVIVIGGGLGGATVAKYLRLWGDAIEVTLVERDTSYTSCILSSLVLTGQRSLSNQSFNYDKLISKYGIKRIQGEVVSIDPVAVKVTLADGKILSADRIVLAPGIDFDEVPGLGTSDKMPHAWKAGPQTALLASQLKAMPTNGTVILSIPPTPYRAAPAPYERASLIADWIKTKKPQGKLVVLDANPDFVIEKDNFSKAFFDLHKNIVTYVPNAAVTQVDPATMKVYTSQGVFAGDVVNLIPRQKAGKLVISSGLNNATSGRFAGVNVLSYASTVAGAEKIHVIGDSSATTQPKAGHMANQQAKVCADAISRILSGGSPDPAPVTNAAAFSAITQDQATWLTMGYQYDAPTLAMKVVAASSATSVGWSRGNFDDMGTWFQALMTDTFA